MLSSYNDTLSSYNFTSVSTKGSSVVDYCLVSHADLDKFSDFYVYTASEHINLNGNINAIVPSSIPDHSCITWVISTETGASVEAEENSQLAEYCLKFNVKTIPDNFASDNSFVNEVHACISQLERTLREQNNVDRAYADICNIVKNEIMD